MPVVVGDVYLKFFARCATATADPLCVTIPWPCYERAVERIRSTYLTLYTFVYVLVACHVDRRSKVLSRD